MPRDIPVGNGQMLVTFDQHYQIRDIYYPHVGQENHTGGSPCRFGVWSPLPDVDQSGGDRRKRRLYWTNQGWDIKLEYQAETMATKATLRHDVLQLQLDCSDVVDFHRCLLVRRMEVKNLTNETRTVHLFHHNNFEMYGTKVGDTACFDPQLRAVIHYRKNRYLMTTWFSDGEQRMDEYATGTAGFFNAEGTWRDAEDGRLGNNAIAQGAVDSTVMVRVELPPNETKIVYMVIGAGFSHDDLKELHHFLHVNGPQGVIDRTTAYWRLWLAASRLKFPEQAQHGPSDKVVDLFKRSLLVVRTQIDNNGAIIAANDTDIMQFARDTYSYLWPRDGALVAASLDDAGFPDVARQFYKFCAEIIDDGGYFLHKYNPDGSPASSWHPWVSLGNPQLPIQEDETALVLWALWRHYQQYRDIEFVRPLWMNLITKAADFLVRFRDPDTHLPLPSYDLWEERWGVHTFTVASVYGGLKAAWQFAICFGDTKRADAYGKAAEQLREAFCKHFWSEEHGRFLRRIVPLDHDRTARLMAEVLAGRSPDRDKQFAALNTQHHGNGNGNGNGRMHGSPFASRTHAGTNGNGNGHANGHANGSEHGYNNSDGNDHDATGSPLPVPPVPPVHEAPSHDHGNGHHQTGRLHEEDAVLAASTASTVEYELDPIIDSSMYAIFGFGLLSATDPRVDKTMRAIEARLWCKTNVGGVARYENDYYHRISDDIRNVAGNPWFICTLWLADWRIAKATSIDELREAMPILDWVANHALPSGVLAEQVHPYSNAPLSVSPLTWSHATVVSTLVAYLRKLEEMTTCPTCGQALKCLIGDQGESHKHARKEPAIAR